MQASPREAFVLHTSCHLRLSDSRQIRGLERGGSLAPTVLSSRPGESAHDHSHLSMSFCEHPSYLLDMALAGQKRPELGGRGAGGKGRRGGGVGTLPEAARRTHAMESPLLRPPNPHPEESHLGGLWPGLVSVSPLRRSTVWAHFFFLPFLSLSFFSCEMGMNYPVDVPRPSRGNWLWPPPPSRPGLPRGKRLRSSGSLVRAGHAEHGAVTADQAGGRCSDFSMCRLTARLADCVHRQCRRGPRERERLRPGLETRVQPSSKRMMLACFL